MIDDVAPMQQPMAVTVMSGIHAPEPKASSSNTTAQQDSNRHMGTTRDQFVST